MIDPVDRRDSGTASVEYPSAASRIMNIDILMMACGLNTKRDQYRNRTFSELLDGVSQQVAGCNLVAKERDDAGLRRDLGQIVKRMLPILPVFNDKEGILAKLQS